MDTKYNDYRRVDNRYTTATGMSSWRFFNVGKYKNQVEPDMIEAEEEVMLDILTDNNMLIDRKS